MLNLSSSVQKLTKLAYLYLGYNQLEAVPHLPESLRVVHLQVRPKYPPLPLNTLTDP